MKPTGMAMERSMRSLLALSTHYSLTLGPGGVSCDDERGWHVVKIGPEGVFLPYLVYWELV